MEAPEITQFRQHILNGHWSSAQSALTRLGVTDEEDVWVSKSSLCSSDQITNAPSQEVKFLIGRQKYLELLEAQQTIPALHVLRNEIAPLNVDPDQLNVLTKYVQPLHKLREPVADTFPFKPYNVLRT